MAETEKILVIKLGALGDFIQASGPMKAIRAAHPHAHITLMTSKPFEKIGQSCGYFDTIYCDHKPRWHQLSLWFGLYNWINSEGFNRVYDLQNSDRSNTYFKLLNTKPEWVGTARKASHRNTSPDRTAGHAFDGHVQTLGLASIENIEIDDLTWLDQDISHFGIEEPYVLLVPGSAPNRPEKRWPMRKYAELAGRLSRAGYRPVILGTDSETEIAEGIQALFPDAIDMTGRTSLGQISALARKASGAIGNDTGPMHLCAATGCVCVTIFSKFSNPVRHAPKGLHSTVVQDDVLENLESKAVFEAFTNAFHTSSPDNVK